MTLSPIASTKFMLVLVCVCLGLAAACAYNKTERPVANAITAVPNAIDINRATAAELMSLPGIGETIAARIVEFREKNGPFRRPEQLLLVPGVSEKKFREIRDLIRADPPPHDE